MAAVLGQGVDDWVQDDYFAQELIFVHDLLLLVIALKHHLIWIPRSLLFFSVTIVLMRLQKPYILNECLRADESNLTNFLPKFTHIRPTILNKCITQIINAFSKCLEALLLQVGQYKILVNDVFGLLRHLLAIKVVQKPIMFLIKNLIGLSLFHEVLNEIRELIVYVGNHWQH